MLQLPGDIIAMRDILGLAQPTTLSYASTMTISLDLPDDLVASLGDTPSEQGRLVREALAVHLYREGRITLRAMGRMAGVGDDYWSAENFREQHRLPADLSAPEDDQAAMDLLRRQG